MKLPPLRIGDLVARIPIIQGGMAVKVSTAPLAAAVAEAGGIGLIAASGLTDSELKEEIKKARELTKGIIGINIMFAVKRFVNLVEVAIQEGIDLIVTGAGFSRDIFPLGKQSNTPIVSIVSSAKLARIAESLGAAAVVVEGKEAGGHLGTDRPALEILPEVREEVKIPVIAAGGILTGKDIAEAFRLGANGVQMATRFVLSEECTVAPEFKEAYMKAKPEDVVIISSPVGMPGRAIKNRFVERIFSGENLKPKECFQCLKKCKMNFCIMRALDHGYQGNMEDGLVFSGERVGEINDILPVKQIINNLVTEAEEYLGKEVIA